MFHFFYPVGGSCWLLGVVEGSKSCGMRKLCFRACSTRLSTTSQSQWTIHNERWIDCWRQNIEELLNFLCDVAMVQRVEGSVVIVIRWNIAFIQSSSFEMSTVFVVCFVICRISQQLLVSLINKAQMQFEYSLHHYASEFIEFIMEKHISFRESSIVDSFDRWIRNLDEKFPVNECTSDIWCWMNVTKFMKCSICFSLPVRRGIYIRLLICMFCISWNIWVTSMTFQIQPEARMQSNLWINISLRFIGFMFNRLTKLIDFSKGIVIITLNWNYFHASFDHWWYFIQQIEIRNVIIEIIDIITAKTVKFTSTRLEKLHLSSVQVEQISTP